MRLVSANVEHARRAGGGPPDAACLANALAALDPDVVALQEVDRGEAASGGVDQPRTVADALGGTAVFAAQRSGGGTGVALVARGPITDVEVLRFVSRRGPRRGRLVAVPLLRPARRAILLARVTVGDATLTVASAHLDLVRAVSHHQLERVVAAVGARPGPHVLAGDLNRWTGWVGPTVAAVDLDLLDDDVPTHPAHAPVRRIDHVATRGLRVVRSEVIALPVGDHRALVVDLDATSPAVRHRDRRCDATAGTHR